VSCRPERAWRGGWGSCMPGVGHDRRCALLGPALLSTIAGCACMTHGQAVLNAEGAGYSWPLCIRDLISGVWADTEPPADTGASQDRPSRLDRGLRRFPAGSRSPPARTRPSGPSTAAGVGRSNPPAAATSRIAPRPSSCPVHEVAVRCQPDPVSRVREPSRCGYRQNGWPAGSA
jgi:hypothetical protein